MEPLVLVLSFSHDFLFLPISSFPWRYSSGLHKPPFTSQEDLKLDHERNKTQSEFPISPEEGRNKQSPALVYMLASHLLPASVMFLSPSWRSSHCWCWVFHQRWSSMSWAYLIASTCSSCVTIKLWLIKYQKEYPHKPSAPSARSPCLPVFQVIVYHFYREIQR